MSTNHPLIEAFMSNNGKLPHGWESHGVTGIRALLTAGLIDAEDYFQFEDDLRRFEERAKAQRKASVSFASSGKTIKIFGGLSRGKGGLYAHLDEAVRLFTQGGAIVSALRDSLAIVPSDATVAVWADGKRVEGQTEPHPRAGQRAGIWPDEAIGNRLAQVIDRMERAAESGRVSDLAALASYVLDGSASTEAVAETAAETATA